MRKKKSVLEKLYCKEVYIAGDGGPRASGFPKAVSS